MNGIYAAMCSVVNLKVESKCMANVLTTVHTSLLLPQSLRRCCELLTRIERVLAEGN